MPDAVNASTWSVTTDARPAAQRAEQVARRADAQALVPRLVARREVRVDRVVAAERGAAPPCAARA
jgi:hypothetical protein